MSAVADVGTVFVREIRPILRGPIGLVFTMAQPLVFLLLFGPLLAGIPGTGGDSPWQWFVPGILIMNSVFATMAIGYELMNEINGGVLERMLATPLNRVSLLIGRMFKDMASLLAQAMVIIIGVLPFGFRLYPVGALLGLVMLGLLGLGLGALTVALAIASRRQQGLFWGVEQFLLFPLVLLSGVLLPLDQAPGWISGMAAANPITYIVRAERALFAGDLTDPSVPLGLLIAAALATVGLILGGRMMKRAGH